MIYTCKSCGERYDLVELPDYEGECKECGADMPKNESEYNKGVEAPKQITKVLDTVRLYRSNNCVELEFKDGSQKHFWFNRYKYAEECHKEWTTKLNKEVTIND